MAETAVDLRSRLRRIAPAEAQRRNALLALLNGAPTPLGPLRAAIDEAPPSPHAPALTFTGGIAATPLVVEGAPAAWLTAAESPRLPEALVELGRLEPLLAAAERRLGRLLDPAGISTLQAGASLRLRLAVRDADGDGDGGDRHALALDIPVALPLPAPPPPKLADLRRLVGAVRLRLEASSRLAPLAELPRLAVGDLVLAEGDAQGIVARLAGADGSVIVGRWRPRDGRFAVGGRMSEEPADATRAKGAGVAPPDLRVRLGFRLGEAEVTLADLAALAPGAVLAAPLAGDAPRVEVTAGGAHIATGRLVALGEAYGVLIDEVHAAPAASPAEGSAA